MSKEKYKCMRVDYVTISNDDFFTNERLAQWRIYMAKCCCEICDGLMKKIDPECHITYFLSKALLYEVVGDAVIGMSKIIDKTPHPIQKPNAFKIAAYLGYWFLRHKPVSVLYPGDTDLNDIRVAPSCKADPKNISWQLKHINEAVAVNMVTSFVFDFDKELCTQRQCKKIKKANIVEEQTCFPFDDFEQQRKLMMQKLTYYFTYRAIAPKVIEHMLEGYAFHPAWALTGAHWDTSMAEADDEE